MQALVIFESMYGNTEKVARAVADGLRERYEVTVADVATMPRAYAMDLLVVGGPTHAFGMTRPSTRKQAAEQGTIRAGAAEVGIREYLDCSPLLPGMAATSFDTRVRMPLMPGSAARKARRRLRRLGCRIVTAPESFLVAGSPGPLVAGELERARRWGAGLAAAAALPHHV
ncbi:flavodoxin domain-containing protein [Actinoplanes sp. N902-109]|uniref:flavodoxin family protein n=1 Tax=Actinoplanes sp. (strain N902-109) TaxID=649831 RepID=UPI00032950FE|nr:flavodoxin domain-containing protein [Actinoplanes sp. N902-109]AGL16934.1 flavodoxin/nitric oxide synthase [Actinoplanes sp. N902-109]